MPHLDLISQDAAIDFEWHGRPTWDEQDDAASFVAWSLDGGDSSLRYTGGLSGSWILRVNGADRVTASMMELSATPGQRASNGQLITVRAWYDAIGNTSGLRMAVNGVYGPAATATAATMVNPPLAAFVGSSDGITPYADMHQVALIARNRLVSRTQVFVGAVLGDSTIATYSPASGVSTPSLLRTNVQYDEPKLIRSLALGGATADDQATAWVGFPEKAGLEWIMVQVGLNDIDPAVSTATSIAKIQNLINSINATKPAGAKVIIGGMIPCYARMITRYGSSAPASYAKWQAMNQAIAGGGGTPITGVDAAVMSHVAAMDGGAGYLDAAYDSGDGIHPNNDGRQVIADAWLVAFADLGVTL